MSEYVAMFESMFVIDPVKGWVPPARDPKRLQVKARCYFADASTNLIRLRNKLMKNPSARAREPGFMAALVGIGEYAYQRDDGIYVIPVGTLGKWLLG
ncbi:AAA family ATPase [Bifidobacterium imperatoris]|uniref:AAA family ATPase n=1 Tax=Bifidobacterium imperatoris TaxID=2020965 RepID=A0A2N5IPE8_9BIFI|nr:AAA family ATPase [Bifidobacterium imperatoris]